MWTGVGPVTVASAGTKVPLSATDIRCGGIMLQAFSNAGHTNTGRIYLFDRNNNRIATLPVPTANNIPAVAATLPISPGGMNLKDYSIDADVSTDGVDVSYLRP